jgi:2-polyprenyl-3-methyl-5-hydroxy-6-metoxy-1,4-benzoquinol methylase
MAPTAPLAAAARSGSNTAEELMSYDPLEYWTSLHERDDLTAVGQSTLPATFNVWMYRLTARRLERFVSAHDLQPSTVIDIGAGVGYWVAWWMSRGASTVDGCDLVPAAVDRLGSRFPGRFDTLDISMAPPRGTYDLVSILNVLLHIVDEVRFESALRNIAAAVRPGGHLLMVEPIQSGHGYKHRYPDGSSSLARPAASYVAPLVEAGLVQSAIEPATVIGSDPYEASSQTAFALWMSLWRLMQRPMHRFPASAGAIGRLIYTVDPLLVRAGFGPSSKIALFRRPP